jgi:hypothetical protein
VDNITAVPPAAAHAWASRTGRAARYRSGFATRTPANSAPSEKSSVVRKGERPIRILAPMKVTHDDPVAAEDAGEEERARVLFRVVPIFDRSQVGA